MLGNRRRSLHRHGVGECVVAALDEFQAGIGEVGGEVFAHGGGADGVFGAPEEEGAGGEAGEVLGLVGVGFGDPGGGVRVGAAVVGAPVSGVEGFHRQAA